MRSRTLFTTFILLTALLFCNTNVKAGVNAPYGDSSCCTPDSLTVVSTSFPRFCVRWHIPDDSSCKNIQGFQIQWKLLLTHNWDGQFVTYTSGSYIDFCDSVDVCGVYQWRVRIKCNDSTYSDWVYGNKFGFDCGGARSITSRLAISPNPASQNITISMKGLQPGKLKITVINMNGRNVFDKTINAQQDQLTERIPISDWQRGIYFVSIFADGVSIRKGSFVKE